MHNDLKPPKKKKPNLEGPNIPDDSRPDKRDQPAAAERTDDAARSSVPEERTTPDASSTDRQPVTNQDEQERITNVGSGNRPIPEN